MRLRRQIAAAISVGMIVAVIAAAAIYAASSDPRDMGPHRLLVLMGMSDDADATDR